MSPAAKHTMTVAVTIALITAGTAWALFTSHTKNGVPLLALVFLAGTIGGVANNYRRVQSIPVTVSVTDSVTDTLLASPRVLIQLLVSPIVGGLFAVILYTAFLSGIVRGVLFPEFRSSELAYEDLQQFLNAATPKNIPDAAKALFWSFIAGFSEHFVPNMIDKVAAEAEQRKDDGDV